MKKKRLAQVLAVALAGAMVLGLAACGSSDSGSSDTGSAGAETTTTSKSSSSGDTVSFTIFNSKSEIQEYMEEMAEEYCETHDVEIEVYYSNDTVAAHLATKYASSDPYTLNMTDAKDIYTLGAEYGYDMSDQDWVNDTDYAISVDGQILGYPVCIEARGIIYNADAIEAITGETFDPDSIQTLDDFDAFCQQLVDGGMESPTAILKPDWSLGAHYLQQFYEEREDVGAYIDELYAGTADVVDDEKYNALMDTFDVLMKYNKFKDSPIAVEDDQVHMATAEGEVAFQFGGCWDWNDIIDYDYTENMGLMPVPQNITDDYTGYLVGGGSKYFYIDNSEYTTDEQRAAAEDFLNWLTYDEAGMTFTADTCGMVSAFSNNDIPCTNVLGQDVKEYADAGKMVPNFDYDPDDHYSILGASMQKYLAGEIDRAGLADEITSYWASTTPVDHN